MVLLSCLKGVFGDSRQAVVHVASSTRVDYYLTYLVGFTQLRRSVWPNNAHQSWGDPKVLSLTTWFDKNPKKFQRPGDWRLDFEVHIEVQDKRQADCWISLESNGFKKLKILPSLLFLTSRHDMSHILYSQGGVLVLCVDPDDTVTKAAHGEDGTSREGGTWDSRSTQHQQWYFFNQTNVVVTKSESVPVTCLRIATVMASGEVAHGQMTSGFSPWDWNTFRKASQEDTDPGRQEIQHFKPNLCYFGRVRRYEALTGVSTISNNQHP